MSLPIGATPLLSGKDAEDFNRLITRDLKNPSRLVPTPKLKQAVQKIRQQATQKK